MTRDALARLAISLRYASPPSTEASLAYWIDYAERALKDAPHRGIIVTVRERNDGDPANDEADDAACVAEMRAEHDADVRRMAGDE